MTGYRGEETVTNVRDIKWPKHECGLWLTHNRHKVYCETVEQAIASDTHGYHDGNWVSPEQRQKAIETNECWTLKWYPHTPAGCILLSACDLDVLLEEANSP